mmetsp:Transcript_120770/g.225764  ORF Transcript_120770/g.225764 Transcript_120770/m.225764 type:complete len:508 (+) Transcript_120770:128-1651(+)
MSHGRTSMRARPPRPGSANKAARSPPPFPARPARPPRAASHDCSSSTTEMPVAPAVQGLASPRALGPPPPELDLPASPPPGWSSNTCITESPPLPRQPPPPPSWQQQHCFLATGSRRRTSASAPPLLATTPEEAELQDFCGFGAPHSSRPPLVRNVAAFEKPKEYSRAIACMPGLHRPVPQGMGRSRNSRGSMRSPIDEAIQREYFGDGMALEQAVDARREAGWAVKHRHLQRSDVGHCCYACRQPLRDMSEEVVVWTGAAIYRRFHPTCAASYVLKVDGAAGGACGSQDGPQADFVEGYADGWRAPRDADNTTMGMGRGRRAVEAARQWLLSQDPSAWPSLRGDLFTTVTIIENGKKKAVPGLSNEQLRILQTHHRWNPSGAVIAKGRHRTMLNATGSMRGARGSSLPPYLRPLQGSPPSDSAAEAQAGEVTEGGSSSEAASVECPICFAALDPQGPPCVQLPCAPQHICHVECVLPWLRKASICPVCRKDLRAMLGGSSARVASR